MALSATIGTLALADVRAVTDQIFAAERFQRSGASTFVYTADRRIDSQRCDALARVAGIDAAGAIRAAHDDVVARVLPSDPVPTKMFSPGFAGLLDLRGSAVKSGAVLSSEAAKSLGVDVGDDLATRTGTTPVQGVYSFPDDGRNVDLAYAALLPTNADDKTPADQCWVRVWPQSAAVTALVKTSLREIVAADASPPELAQLNPRFGSQFAGLVELEMRPTRWASAAGVILGLALGFVSMRLRRLELAAALHAGLRPAAVFAVQIVQGSIWIAVSALVELTGVLFATHGLHSPDTRAAAATGSLTVAAGCLAALAGIGLGVLSTRERHLFRYFKNR